MQRPWGPKGLGGGQCGEGAGEGGGWKGEVKQSLAACLEPLHRPWVQWKPQEDSEKRRRVT